MNLFHQKRVEQLFAEIYERLRVEINNIDIANVEDLNDKSRQLAEKYKVDIPSIHKDGITSSLNLEDMDEHVYQENAYASYPRKDVVATATFTVPITGDGDFFGLVPTTYTQNSFSALISGESLKFKIRTGYVRMELSEDWKEFIKRTSINAVEQIETNLKNLATDFDKFNTGLFPQILQALEERKKDCIKKKEIERDINPFK